MCMKLSKWKIKTAQVAFHILALSAKFFNFFPPIYTLGKLQNLIVSHSSLRLSPIPNLGITVATQTKCFPMLISVVRVMEVIEFSEFQISIFFYNTKCLTPEITASNK